MSVAAIVVVELFYFFPADPLLYVAGAARVNADHDPNYLVFMGGRLAPQFSSYFLVTYLLKESLPEPRAVHGRTRRRRRGTGPWERCRSSF